MTVSAEQLFRVFPSSGVPIYRQVMNQVRSLLLSGRLGPGDYLPSVRAVSSALEVNPMTVSKAYSLLEAEDVVERVRGLGMRVREAHHDGPASARLAELRPLLEQIAARAHQLAVSPDAVVSALKPLLRDPGE